MPIQRPVIAVNTSHQLDLFPGWELIPPDAGKPEPSGGVIFKRPGPRERFVCGVRLGDYLTRHGQARCTGYPRAATSAELEPFEGHGIGPVDERRMRPRRCWG